MNDLDFQKMADKSSYEPVERELEFNWWDKPLARYINAEEGGGLTTSLNYPEKKQTYEDYIEELTN